MRCRRSGSHDFRQNGHAVRVTLTWAMRWALSTIGFHNCVTSASSQPPAADCPCQSIRIDHVRRKSRVQCCGELGSRRENAVDLPAIKASAAFRPAAGPRMMEKRGGFRVTVASLRGRAIDRQPSDVSAATKVHLPMRHQDDTELTASGTAACL